MSETDRSVPRGVDPFAFLARFAPLIFLVLLMAVLAVFPGIIRSSMGLKTMLPESSVPGWIVTLIAPIYLLVVLVREWRAGEIW